jgi:prepilin peptidase CpaA
MSAGLPLGEAGIHLAVGFAFLLAGMGLFAAGLLGGGDAKLLAAVALYMGSGWAAPYVMAVAVAGGGLACAVLLLRWAARQGFTATMPWLSHLADPKLGIPYGVAIAAGWLFVFPKTHLFALATAA